MRRITVVNNVTLDGVMQAPAGPDEDRRGGFEHGGWAMPYQDDVLGRKMGEGMARGGDLLFGRRTYENMFAFWPKQTDGNPFTPVLDAAQKYVVSRTLSEPLPWVNSTLLPGDAAESVGRLKAEPGSDLTILGSGELVRSLATAGLVDEYLLIVHPLVLGSGRRLFPEGLPRTGFELVDTLTTTTGVIIATYRTA